MIIGIVLVRPERPVPVASANRRRKTRSGPQRAASDQAQAVAKPRSRSRPMARCSYAEPIFPAAHQAPIVSRVARCISIDMIEPADHRILSNIIYQHAENASFLFLQRDQAVVAPNYTRQDIVELDERIEANIEGLRIAGSEGYQIALEQLEANQEPGELFTCSLLALEARDQKRFAQLSEIGGKADGACLGLRGAIGWCDAARLKPWVQPWLDSSQAFERYLAMVACSLHRADPGTRLAEFLNDEDPSVRSRAARLVGELGRADLRDVLFPLAQTDRWAAWSLGLIQDHTVIPRLQQLAAEGWSPALQVIVRLMGSERSRNWIRGFNGDPNKTRLMIQALGILGDPQSIPWLISQMDNIQYARVAGESFSLVTGVDIAALDLDRIEQMSSSEDQEDEFDYSDEDENLPWPDKERCNQKWQELQSAYITNERYLCGEIIRQSQGKRIDLFQNQNRAMSYELACTDAVSLLRNFRSKHVAA